MPPWGLRESYRDNPVELEDTAVVNHLDSTGSESAARLDFNSGGCVWGTQQTAL